MEPLLQALLENYSVQLEHDKTERDSMNHGAVTLLFKGEELGRCENYQHNKNYRNRFDLNDDLLDKISERMEELKKPKKPPSFIESDIPTRVEYEKWLKKTWPDFAPGAVSLW